MRGIQGQVVMAVFVAIGAALYNKYLEAKV